MSIWDTLQEVRELGLRRTLFRAVWELKVRTGLMGYLSPQRKGGSPPLATVPDDWAEGLPFTDPEVVARAMADRLPQHDLTLLRQTANDAARGSLLCFGRWRGDFGNPVD